MSISILCNWIVPKKRSKQMIAYYENKERNRDKINARARAYYLANKEKIREQRKSQRDYQKEYKKLWRKQNRAKCLEYAKKHKAKNPDYTREKRKQYIKAAFSRNPELKKIKNRKKEIRRQKKIMEQTAIKNFFEINAAIAALKNAGN